MKICIITDDNAGFTQDEVKKLGIGIVPMPVIINGEIYFENKNIDQEQFYLKQNGGSDIIYYSNVRGRKIKNSIAKRFRINYLSFYIFGWNFTAK